MLRTEIDVPTGIYGEARVRVGLWSGLTWQPFKCDLQKTGSEGQQ